MHNRISKSALNARIGSNAMKQKHLVNAHKFLTAFAVLALMALYNRWENQTLWVYLALHGTYGMIWLIKDRTYPDKRWEQVVPLPRAIGLYSTLTLYWIAPWIIAANNIEAPIPYIAFCISLYTFGIFLHYTSDMQKHMALLLKPGNLWTDGLWGMVRNPNYLGELLIYLGFGLLAMHWLPIAIIAVVVLVIWLPNMRRKDQSLSRYPQYADYQRRTRRLLPYLF